MVGSQTGLRKPGGEFRFRLAAIAFCLIFGLAYILNVHPIGDGLWFWYAVRVRQGSRLYSEMHLSLQPLYVLLTAAFQQIFGLSWLASKILPALQMGTYCGLLYVIGGYIRWPDWARAVVLLAVYFLTISGQFYRFDDYHITSDIFGLLCIYLLLRLKDERRPAAILLHAALIGAACGLCTSNRLNDGALLFVSSLVAIAFMASRRRFTSIVLATATTALALLAVVLATHDSPREWAVESILRASKIKGGTGNILLFPLGLPLRLVKSYAEDHTLPGICWFGILLAFACIARHFWPARAAWKPRLVLLASSLAAFAGIFLLRESLRGGVPVQFFSTTAALALLLGSVVVLVRGLRARSHPGVTDWSSVEVLLLIPAAQLLGAAMTSATVLPNLTPPVAQALLIFPIVLATATSRRLVWAIATVCIGVMLPALQVKVRHPYYWHHYLDGPMFFGRQWYAHPKYGRMYIESGQLAEMLPMCRQIEQSSASGELLSLPYPYPNYFCAVPPWHEYVQTWYDTASPELIHTLVSELKASPPRWIAYQHDLDTIRVHEWAFTNGRQLPHRELEHLIAGKLADGSWALDSRSCLDHSEWMLIRTGPPTTLVEQNLQAGFLRKPTGFCEQPSAAAQPGVSTPPGASALGGAVGFSVR